LWDYRFQPECISGSSVKKSKIIKETGNTTLGKIVKPVIFIPLHQGTIHAGPVRKFH